MNWNATRKGRFFFRLCVNRCTTHSEEHLRGTSFNAEGEHCTLKARKYIIIAIEKRVLNVSSLHKTNVAVDEESSYGRLGQSTGQWRWTGGKLPVFRWEASSGSENRRTWPALKGRFASLSEKRRPMKRSNMRDVEYSPLCWICRKELGLGCAECKK